MQTFIPNELQFFWDSLCMLTQQKISLFTSCSMSYDRARRKLQSSSTAVFAQRVMGLPSPADLIDVVGGKSLAKLPMFLPSYSDRFAYWALETPLKPVYFAWKFRNYTDLVNYDFGNAKCLGIVCCPSDIRVLMENDSNIGFSNASIQAPRLVLGTHITNSWK